MVNNKYDDKVKENKILLYIINNYNLVKPISEYFCLLEIYEELDIEYID